ncbi:hypothetical protein PUN28_002171 [Cardiocondyla obscurior]|uniref:Uncharacterized protein n=1 Tax=Cardiocondyla obscurior TaxID=286306 RepID=A0AAW2GSV0_9HYME
MLGPCRRERERVGSARVSGMSVSRTAGSARSKEGSGAPESRRCRCRGWPGAPERRKARKRPSSGERNRFRRPGEPGRGRLGSAQVLEDRMLGCSPARKRCLVCARGGLYTRGPGSGGPHSRAVGWRCAVWAVGRPMFPVA